MSNQKKFGNNWEREIYLDEASIGDRARTRYAWAASFIPDNSTVLDIGCSTGFGRSLLPKNIHYTGLDKDSKSIELAEEHYPGNVFVCSGIEEFVLPRYGTIIAFEFLEHVENGAVLAQTLKQHCNQLICSVPYNELPGLWGKHHVLHNLMEDNFPDFEYKYVSFKGNLLDKPVNHTGKNLMLMRWVR